jgi:antitoxin YefM
LAFLRKIGEANAKTAIYKLSNRGAQRRSDAATTCYGFYTWYSLYSYGNPVQMVIMMDTVSVNQFRDNLKTFVEQVVSNHTPIKVTRRAGEAFVVVSADDWEREQETLYVLQNSSLMTQISKSLATHTEQKGYAPTDEEINEITRI